MFSKSFSGLAPLSTTVASMPVVWCIILVPWVPYLVFMGTGMAFEGGNTFDAYRFVILSWLYPVFVGVAFFFRRRRPALIWLPLVALIPMCAEFFGL